MNDFNPFETFEAPAKAPKNQEAPAERSQPRQTIQRSPENPFESAAFEEPEGLVKSTLRSLLQVPKGVAQAATYFMDLVQLASHGDIFDEEEIERIEQIAKREGVPFDRDKYYESAGRAFETFPTVSNISRTIEETTGVPLEAKTNFQKAVNFGSTVGGFIPKASGNFFQRQLMGAGVSGVEQILEGKGLPRPVAEVVSSGLAGIPAGEDTGRKLSISKKTKPSGLPVRQYEKKVTEPSDVTPKKIRQIEKKVQSDFAQIQKDIEKSTPVNVIRDVLKKNPNHKAEVRESFKVVEDMAKNIKKTFEPNLIRKQLKSKMPKKSDRALGFSEYEKEYINESNKLLKGIDVSKKGEKVDTGLFLNEFEKAFVETPGKKVKVSPAQALAKYRDNNRQLAEIYESGKSGAFNRAKRDALLDFNTAIANVLEKEFKDTDFIKNFKPLNKHWSLIKDVEAIDNFHNSLFKDGIKFERGAKWLEREGLQEPFKRALGKEGYSKYKQLLNDLMTTEQASKLMRQADKQGLSKYLNSYLLYKLSPVLGKSSIVMKGATSAYRRIWESMLDKPEIMVQYSKAINAAKAGNFKVAKKIFDGIELKVLGKEEAEKLSKAEDEFYKSKK